MRERVATMAELGVALPVPGAVAPAARRPEASAEHLETLLLRRGAGAAAGPLRRLGVTTTEQLEFVRCTAPRRAAPPRVSPLLLGPEASVEHGQTNSGASSMADVRAMGLGASDESALRALLESGVGTAGYPPTPYGSPYLAPYGTALYLPPAPTLFTLLDGRPPLPAPLPPLPAPLPNNFLFPLLFGSLLLGAFGALGLLAWVPDAVRHTHLLSQAGACTPARRPTMAAARASAFPAGYAPSTHFSTWQCSSRYRARDAPRCAARRLENLLHAHAEPEGILFYLDEIKTYFHALR